MILYLSWHHHKMVLLLRLSKIVTSFHQSGLPDPLLVCPRIHQERIDVVVDQIMDRRRSQKGKRNKDAIITVWFLLKLSELFSISCYSLKTNSCSIWLKRKKIKELNQDLLNLTQYLLPYCRNLTKWGLGIHSLTSLKMISWLSLPIMKYLLISTMSQF